MGLLGKLNDRFWYLVEGSTEWDPAIDAYEDRPDDWPTAQDFIFGMITLIDADTIEYTIPGRRGDRRLRCLHHPAARMRMSQPGVLTIAGFILVAVCRHGRGVGRAGRDCVGDDAAPGRDDVGDGHNDEHQHDSAGGLVAGDGAVATRSS